MQRQRRRAREPEHLFQRRWLRRPARLIQGPLQEDGLVQAELVRQGGRAGLGKPRVLRG